MKKRTGRKSTSPKPMTYDGGKSAEATARKWKASGMAFNKRALGG